MTDGGPRATRRQLSPLTSRSRSQYARCVSGDRSNPWWTTVIITASSERQAERYRAEIRRRRESGRLPGSVGYLVVPDPDGVRIGSGGATLNALRALYEAGRGGETSEQAWQSRRVLLIHSGGDSRRLPQYSLSGKLFSTLPVKTPWGDVSTVFDELLAFSTGWASRLGAGLVVVSGDVVLLFDPRELRWERPGVCGVAMPRPPEVGRRHGVYVAGPGGRVRSFLQKAGTEQMHAAGALLPDDQVALDTGLLRFDPATAARLSAVAEVWEAEWERPAGATPAGAAPPTEIDLYQHFAGALTGEWAPGPQARATERHLAEALAGVPFHCDLVNGEFTHVGTTALFRELMTSESEFASLYEADQRVRQNSPVGTRSARAIIDSVLPPESDLADNVVAIECNLSYAIQAGRGAILHGLTDETGLRRVPENTVVHQVPVVHPDGQRGTVVRVYGVSDDPKITIGSEAATWFGRPILAVLEALNLRPDTVWEGVPAKERSLWNARLFPLATPAQAGRWAAAALDLMPPEDTGEPAGVRRLSLASSALWADDDELLAARARLRRLRWHDAAWELLDEATRQHSASLPSQGPAVMTQVGEALVEHANAAAERSPTRAASVLYEASCLLARAGHGDAAREARAEAFARVRQAVSAAVGETALVPETSAWRHEEVCVAAPARADLGGGWSDTPPFCLDWGGTVFNVALTVDGACPIMTTVRRLDEPVIRCLSSVNGQQKTFATAEELQTRPKPGCPFSIPRTALQMLDLLTPEETLAAALERRGGGLEISSEVALPMGSGLGTSSILGATMLQALVEMLGYSLDNHDLTRAVMCLEQRMTTGGGWQDQAGGMFPGAKLLSSAPGSDQQLQVDPVCWADGGAAELGAHLLVHYTGCQRIAKGILGQVVGSYLARDATTLRVLHSIKTLAEEMRYACQESDWLQLGRLVARHWQLNLEMLPQATNAPTNAVLRAAAPYAVGAKAAGAGGGGCLVLITPDAEATEMLRERLSEPDVPGEVYNCALAEHGLQVTRR